MFHYRLYCTDILSDMELYQPRVGDGNPDPDNTITIREGKMPEEYKFDRDCYSYIKPDCCYLSNSICYLYIPDGNTLIYEKKPDHDYKNLANYLLGWGISMVFYRRVTAIIHCSALYNDKGAILISGQSGAGKSTVTTGLLDKGLKFLADDTSAVTVRGTEAYATPCYPYRKLCRDVVVARNLNIDDLLYIDEDKDKFMVPWTDFFPDYPIKVAALFYVELSQEDSEVRIEEITGFAKMSYIYGSLFLSRLLRPGDQDKFLFQMCLSLAGSIKVFRVTRPIERDTREELPNVIYDTISTL